MDTATGAAVVEGGAGASETGVAVISRPPLTEEVNFSNIIFL
jgi:hypothetical protein